MELLDKKDFTNLKENGFMSIKLLLDAKFPLSLQTYISSAYQHLSNGKELAVAVRNSAATEALCNESFAGGSKTVWIEHFIYPSKIRNYSLNC